MFGQVFKNHKYYGYVQEINFYTEAGTDYGVCIGGFRLPVPVQFFLAD